MNKALENLIERGFFQQANTSGKAAVEFSGDGIDRLAADADVVHQQGHQPHTGHGGRLRRGRAGY